MVEEVGVLFRVQQLQECGRRVSLDPSADLVHLVNQDERVFRLHLLKALDDLPRHGSDVSPPVALYLRHICHPTHTEPEVLGGRGGEGRGGEGRGGEGRGGEGRGGEGRGGEGRGGEGRIVITETSRDSELTCLLRARAMD